MEADLAPRKTLFDLAKAVPGARIIKRDEETPDTTIEHMYKPHESVFGAVAHAMVKAGWSIFPQEQDGNRRPGTVNKEMIKWSEDHKLSTEKPRPEILDLWTAQCPHLNVAVVLGPASGNAFVLDIDVTDEDLSAMVQEIAERILGRTPLRRVGRWPKIAFVYRHAEDDVVAGRSWRFADYDEAGNIAKGDNGIEIISSGQAMTFYGKHHKTGRYFTWLDGPPQILGPESAPIVTAAMVDDFMEAVDSVRRFYRVASFETSITTWEWDEDAQVHIPRIRASGPASWVEDESGKVIDGREVYLRNLALRISKANPQLSLEGSGKGLEMLIRIVYDQFTATADTSGRWRGRSLENEVRSKVTRAVAGIKSGKISTFAPKKDSEGKYISTSHSQNHIPPQPRDEKGDSLDFLPPAVDVNSVRTAANAHLQRAPIRCEIKAPEDGAEKARRLSPKREKVASGVVEGLNKAFNSFWDDVYDTTRRKSRIHILKAPTGAGKTSRGIQFIATDPRTKDEYTIRGPNGEIEFEGRSPIVFMLPTYANIGELRNRAEVLNLDPNLSDAELREQAAEKSLIHEDDLEAKLEELRRDAKNAGITTMVYRGKLMAGCQMSEKVKLAMEAGVGTAGFCKAEVKTGEKDEDGKFIVEEKFCPFYNDCEAIKQRQQIQKCHVVFAPHAFLSLQIPEELQHVRAVVADERIHHLFLHTATFNINSLSTPRKMPKLSKKERDTGVDENQFHADRADAAAIVNSALMKGECPVEALVLCKERNKDGTPSAPSWVKSAIRVCGASIQRDGTITPELTIEEIKKICSQPTGVDVREEYRFWKIIEERLDARIKERVEESLARGTGREIPRTTKGDREYRIQKLEDISPKGEVINEIRISWRETPNWINRPLLLLDASAAPDMISKIWSGKEVVVHDIPAELNVRIVGIVDQTYSNASVVAPPSATPKEKLGSAILLNKIRKSISMLSVLFGWSRVVAGASILVRRAVNTDWEGPNNVDWCHFGAMRGLDFAKNHAAAVSIGRMELPIRTIDGLVAALTYDDDIPEQPYDLRGTGLAMDRTPLRTPMGKQRIRMRSGHDIEMAIPMFPGRWGRMIQKQYREEELLQFLGRLRPVYREGEAPIWFSLSSVIPEEVIVDDLIKIDDFLDGAGGSKCRIWEAIRRGGGVMDIDVAYETCSDLYASRQEIVTEMKKFGLDPETGAAEGRVAWGLVAIRWKETGGREGISYVRADFQDPEGTLRNVRTEIVGETPKSCKKISKGRNRTLARGRDPDKIEAELGTLDSRRAAERQIADEAAVQVLMAQSKASFTHMKDAIGSRKLPLQYDASFLDDDEEGKSSETGSLVGLEVFSTKMTIDRLWASLKAKNAKEGPETVGAAGAAEVDGAKVVATATYENAANHVRDVDDDGEYDPTAFDEEDLLIPW
jgi:hypothetical protein